jgi:transketolase
MVSTGTLTRKQKANAIRALAMDAVERAKSGHPGAPMGLADIAEVLWNDFLQHNPRNPNWFNRDRFVLSNGHASMLLYSLLHLSGYDLSIDDLKNFRQLNSRTPGHPEFGYTPGVETTTGPLGQGFANAVGFAIAEKVLAAKFNKDNFNIVDHHTYVIVGDGCLMEGISHEAASLAGTLGLSKLIAIWDDNKISIDGDVTPWFSENTAARFKAYGWNVIEQVDGHDAEQIIAAIMQAKNFSQDLNNKPTLICCQTVIGYGAPNKQKTEDVHGSPLGSEEILNARKELNWEFEPFALSDLYYKTWSAVKKGADLESAWNELFVKYEAVYPTLAKEFLRRKNSALPANWDKVTTDYIYSLQSCQENMATRKSSQNVLTAYAAHLPELFGGSADLTGSNGTLFKNAKIINSTNWDGEYLHYGVREFAMAAICNGMALYKGFIPYGGTFLTFLDYNRNAVRMAAIMKQRNIFVFTHDSIALGEDGPTHQPIEHLAMLRATPNLDCWRPCDAVETAVAWREAIAKQDGPSVLALTRQNVRAESRTTETIENIAKGGYILAGDDLDPDLILIATGSEVELAMAVKAELADYNIRVVSMPCVDRFHEQSDFYKSSVISDNLQARLIIEAGCSQPWFEFVASRKQILSIDCYGESAPAADLFKHFGFTVDNIVSRAKELIMMRK